MSYGTSSLEVDLNRQRRVQVQYILNQEYHGTLDPTPEFQIFAP